MATGPYEAHVVVPWQWRVQLACTGAGGGRTAADCREVQGLQLKAASPPGARNHSRAVVVTFEGPQLGEAGNHKAWEVVIGQVQAVSALSGHRKHHPPISKVVPLQVQLPEAAQALKDGLIEPPDDVLARDTDSSEDRFWSMRAPCLPSGSSRRGPAS